MTKRQRNKLSMLIAVGNVFKKYQAIVETIPALQSNVENFFKLLEEIDGVILVQEGNINSTATDKQKEEQEMIDATVRIAAGLYVYAIDNSNFDLLERVNISPSTLARQPEVKLNGICQNVLLSARQYLENLVDYGISAEEVDQFEKEISDFKAAIGSPRSQIISRSQATAKLQELLIEQTDHMLQKLDKLVIMTKQSNEVFCNEYKSARIIVNLGIRHTAEIEEEV